MKLSFRFKIFSAISFVTFLGLAAIFSASLPVIEERVNQYIENEILRVYSVLDRVQVQARQTQMLQASLLSERKDLGAAIDAFNFDPSEFSLEADVLGNEFSAEDLKKSAISTINDIVRTLLDRYSNTIDPDFVLLTDINGEILFSSGDLAVPEGGNATAHEFWNLADSDLNSTPFVYDSHLYQVVLEPTFYNEEPIGFFAIGYKVDSQWIQEIIPVSENMAKTGIGQMYVIYLDSDGVVLASNLPASRMDQMKEALIPAFQKEIQFKNPNAERVFGYAQGFEEISGRYWPVESSSSKTAAYEIVITSKTSALNAFLNRLYIPFIGIAAAVLAVAGMVGYWISKSVTKPVDILVGAANELSAGNLQHQVEYRSNDEMGLLAETFDEMRKSILKRIEEIQSLQDELIQKEKLASIGSMASAINHEIRNQLSFGMAAELIRQQHPEDQQVQSYTQMILDARDYILRMLDDIRNFTRANQNVEYTREAKNIKETVERTLKFIRFDNELKHVEIEEELEECGDAVLDHQRIGQVIINLARNAGHAMDRKGEVVVLLKDAQENVRIEVQDSGCGIPPENLDKIWRQFFSTKGDKGLGLGLDICKKIIEDHKGTIYCESEVGKGTTFFIELPKQQGAKLQ